MVQILHSLDLIIVQVEMCKVGRKLEILNASELIVVQIDDT